MVLSGNPEEGYHFKNLSGEIITEKDQVPGFQRPDLHR